MLLPLQIPRRRRRRRRFAAAERGSRVLQVALKSLCGRVRAAEDAPRDPVCVLERRHGLAEIVERGTVVLVERRRANPPRLERGVMTFTENASRHRHRFAQQRLGLFEALLSKKGRRVVVGRQEGGAMFLTMQLQTSGVYISFNP